MRVPISPLDDEAIAEKESLAAEILAGEMVEPTEEEKKNGWTRETLTKYISDRLAAQALSVDVNSLTRKLARKKDEQNHKYRPLRWRE